MTRIFQRTLVATSLAFAMGSASAVAIKPGVAPTPAKPKSHLKSTAKRDISNLYFIHFDALPLAAYQSELATGVRAQHLTKNNKLNVHSPASTAYVNTLKQQRSSVLMAAQGVIKRNIAVEHEYNYVANAVTARLSEQEVAALQVLAGVRFIDKVQLKPLNTDSGPGFIKAPAAWSGEANNGVGSLGEGKIVGVLDTGINPHSPSFSDVGADGYDHTNPLGQGVYLADCIEHTTYCNDKLIGIWSHPVITDKDTPEGEAPIGVDYHSHGSHTASTAAGNVVKNIPINVMIDEDGDGALDIDYASNYTLEQISGVAPHANIVSYQVCDNGEMGCWTDLTVLAVEHAVANGIDVINYSVGGGASDAWFDSDSLAFLSARKAGIHVATSAGNSGPDAGTVGSPGNAPWVTTVAAYTHDRDFTEKTLANFSGGETSLTSLTGKGVTGALTAPIVLAENFGDGDCLTPFEQGTFTGQIVVCNRGQIARVSKGVNVAAGGAAGLILINTSDDETVENDYHFIPAIHLNASQGAELVDWLKSGDNHQATISDSQLISNPENGDRAAWFTSRGPEPIFGQYLAPHIAAPGVDIYAASAQYDQAYSEGAGERAAYMFMSGTSMSSPHVAGALALMSALKPDWSPAEVQSAMMMTAHFDTYDHEGAQSDFYDGGAGSLRIDKALNTGLLMDISYQNYMDASPTEGGDASTLNMPAMLKSDCFMSCSWTRTFKATQAGTWTVSDAAITPGMTVTATPSQFTLAAGEQITLDVTATAGVGLASDTVLAHLVLTPNNSVMTTSRLPVIANFIAGSAPQEVRVEDAENQGQVAINGVISVGTDALNVTTYPLNRVNQETVEVMRDDYDTSPWPTSVYNNTKYNWSTSVSVNDKAKALVARIKHTSSPDLDLYVGRDANFNGKLDGAVEFDRLACMSATETAYESCYIVNPDKGNYAIEVHNFGNPNEPTGETDSITIEWVVIGSDSDHVLNADYTSQLAPGVDAQLFVNWDTQLEELTRYMGAVEIGTSSNTPNNIGFTYIDVLRGEDMLSASSDLTEVLAGDALTYTVQLKPNKTDAAQMTEVVTSLPTQLSVLASNPEVTINGDSLSWQVEQAAGGEATTMTITFDTSAVTVNNVLELMVSATTNEVSETVTAAVVNIEGLPQAIVSDAEQSHQEGSAVTLSAAQSTAPGQDETLTYVWTQTSGPALELSDVNNVEISFTAPSVDATTQFTFDVMVSNGKQQATATATLTVTDTPPPPPLKSKSSSGSMAWLLMLCGIFGIARRKLRR